MSHARVGTITGEQAADWIVRSALSTFCDLVGLTEDAAWFRQLPPYRGHTQTGRLRGWQGAGRRVLAVEAKIHDVYGELHRNAREAGRPLNASDLDGLDPVARAEVRSAAVFARKAMLPSRVGWDAYRVFSAIDRFAAHAGHFYDQDDTIDTINDVWHAAWTAISDRARLNSLDELAAPASCPTTVDAGE